VASAISVQALREMLGQDAIGDQKVGTTPESRLAEAMRWANRSVWEAARQERANEGMGTTLVCAIVDPDGTVTIANVGDSRAYLVSPSGSRLLTTDHSWVNDQVRAGRMSEKDAETSPYRHILSRSLGVMPDVDVDVYSGLRLTPGDTLVLCSDGVSMYLRHAGEIVTLCRATSSAQEMAECLVAAALDRGGADNATVVAVRAV
jgi:protein phosphatase